MRQLLFILFLMGLVSCGRTKDTDELVLSEMIIEKDGIYYSGDCEAHADKKYTGTDTFYHFDNGKIKGTFTIKNGLPDGHWEQFNVDGSKKLDLYFDHGRLTGKNVNK